MPGYVIAHFTVHDPETYARYRSVVLPTLEHYGGRPLVVSHESRVLEGNPDEATVVVEFESVEAAQRWFDSPEYREIIHLRTSSTEGWLQIAPHFEMPHQ